MQTTTPRLDRRAPERPLAPFRFRRSAHDRVVAGVAGGLGERLEVDPVIVRLALVALAPAGGAGVLAYLGAWLLSDEPDEAHPAETPPSSLQQTLAIGCMLLGALLLLRTAGIWFGDAWVWPVALAVLGSALIWTRGDEDVRARWASLAQRLPGFPGRALAGGVSPARIAVGGLFIAAGMAGFLAANNAFPQLRTLGFAVAVTVTGAALILGPGVLALGRRLSEERRDRIRSQERAEMAAHLHDSVLQTLALLQRTDSQQEVARLARAQERELRAWLYGRSSALEHDHLATALEAMASKVEAAHDVAVEVVVVGDRPLDDQLQAIVLAGGEAMTNAARHSGAADVSVYVEVEPAAVTAYVRDQGKGFDVDAVPGDRRGISDSILGRMERAGGSAHVESRPGEGTEVQLTLPRNDR